MHAAQLMVAAAVAALLLAVASAEQHGWRRGEDSLAGPCTVQQRSWRSLSVAQFEAQFKERQPVLLTELPPNDDFAQRCGRDELLRNWVRRPRAWNVCVTLPLTGPHARRASTQ